jgi:hypothetical protein
MLKVEGKILMVSRGLVVIALDWLLLTDVCYLEVVVRTGLTVFAKQWYN